MNYDEGIGLVCSHCSASAIPTTADDPADLGRVAYSAQAFFPTGIVRADPVSEPSCSCSPTWIPGMTSDEVIGPAQGHCSASAPLMMVDEPADPGRVRCHRKMISKTGEGFLEHALTGLQAVLQAFSLTGAAQADLD